MTTTGSFSRPLYGAFWATVVASLIIVPGCTHKSDAVAQLNSAVAPFTQARNQAVALIASAKHSLGPDDLNALAAAYSSLEQKGNDYAGFLVESAGTVSFDSTSNEKYASQLTDAIKAFNKKFGSIAPAKLSGSTLPSTWVPGFAGSLGPYWDQYRTQSATIPPKTRADLIKQLKSDTVWPNYENIATEPVSVGNR